MGSGWVLAGSGWVLELKNDTSKIIEIHCKKQCFGLRRLQDGAKMDPENALFWSVKILRIHCKNRVKFIGLDPITRQFLKGLISLKHFLSQPMVLSQRELDL